MQNGSSLLCWLRREYRPQYEALRLVESTTPTDDEEPSESIFYLRKRLERLQKIIVYLKAGLVLISVASVLVFSYSTCAPERIGIDPNGLVPPNIGEPPQWTYFGKNSPYYIEEDTFFSLTKTIETVKRINTAHNSSNILVNGHYAKWKHPDGSRSILPPYYSTVSVRQTYIIRSFHQMHCWTSIAEEYGYRVNNQSSQWPPNHIAHCLNAIREAIMCLADATPMSFVNGFANGHVTDDQQFMCRDWAALKRWANDPERGVRYRNLGEKKQQMVEIIPFPELSEAEREGGIGNTGWNGRVVDDGS